MKDLIEELPTNVPKATLTEQDMQEFYVKKNLMHGLQAMLDKYASAGTDGFINHVISETGNWLFSYLDQS